VLCQGYTTSFHLDNVCGQGRFCRPVYPGTCPGWPILFFNIFLKKKNNNKGKRKKEKERRTPLSYEARTPQYDTTQTL
jgi:hypothetical protein